MNDDLGTKFFSFVYGVVHFVIKVM